MRIISNTRKRVKLIIESEVKMMETKVRGQKQSDRQVLTYLSNRIIDLLGEGIPAEMTYSDGDKGISCNKAVEVLNYTIQRIKNEVPLDFTR